MSWFVMIPTRKALRLSEVSLKMLFSGADNTKKQRIVQMDLHLFRRRESQATAHQMGLQSVHSVLLDPYPIWGF